MTGDDLPSYYSNKRLEIISHIPKSSGRILDVGCAAGEFGRALKDQRPGVVVHGVEPHDDAALRAEKVLDRVYRGTFGKPALESLAEGVPYSCIVFNDVLEHMEWPGEALRLACDAIETDGAVVASIPNFRNWETLNQVLRNGSFKYVDKGVLDRTHLRFFCKADIRELFESVGMQVQTLAGNSPLNVKNWQRWKLVSRLIGNGLADEGRYIQFTVVATPKGNAPAAG